MYNPSKPRNLHSIQVLPPIFQDVLYLPLTYSTSAAKIYWNHLHAVEQVPLVVEPLLPERAKTDFRNVQCKVGSHDDVLLGLVSNQAHDLLGKLADKLLGGMLGRLSSNFAFDFTSDRDSYGSVRWSHSEERYEVMIHPYSLLVCESMHSFAGLLAHEIGHTMIPRGTVHPGGAEVLKELYQELQAYYSKADNLDISGLSNYLSPEQIRDLEIPYIVKEEKRHELEEKKRILERGLLLLSRQNEHTADLTACDLLYSAGFDPRGIIELHEQIRPSQEPFPSTHPSFHERITKATEHISLLLTTKHRGKSVCRGLEQDYYYLRLQIIPAISRQLDKL